MVHFSISLDHLWALPVKKKMLPESRRYSMLKREQVPSRNFLRYIYRTYITRNGQRIYARDHGLKAWKIPIYADE